MKYIVELLLTYEVDAPDLRQAQITAYKRAIDLCNSEDDMFKYIDKDMKCVSSMVFVDNDAEGFSSMRSM
jgi:hypothetical protein